MCAALRAVRVHVLCELPPCRALTPRTRLCTFAPTHPPTHSRARSYGFPPGVGATGTAALLNVPRSLEALLCALRREGYDLGGVGEAGEESAAGGLDGEALVAALRAQEDQRAISGGWVCVS